MTFKGFLAFVFIIIGIVITICLIVYFAPKPLDKVILEVINQLSFRDATEGLTPDKIYTPKRGQIKAGIYKKSSVIAQGYWDAYQVKKAEFMDILRKKGVLNEKGQVPYERINSVQPLFDSYMKTNRSLLQKNVLTEGISPKEFFYLHRKMQGDCVGVYILCNQSNGKHYVGQAKRLYYRVNQHFTGKGNPDVYRDYVNGNEFLIKMIKLTESGYSDIDKLEKDKIEEYQAYYRGYNKTIGNG